MIKLIFNECRYNFRSRCYSGNVDRLVRDSNRPLGIGEFSKLQQNMQAIYVKQNSSPKPTLEPFYKSIESLSYEVSTSKDLHLIIQSLNEVFAHNVKWDSEDVKKCFFVIEKALLRLKPSFKSVSLDHLFRILHFSYKVRGVSEFNRPILNLCFESSSSSLDDLFNRFQTLPKKAAPQIASVSIEQLSRDLPFTSFEISARILSFSSAINPSELLDSPQTYIDLIRFLLDNQGETGTPMELLCVLNCLNNCILSRIRTRLEDNVSSYGPLLENDPNRNLNKNVLISDFSIENILQEVHPSISGIELKSNSNAIFSKNSNQDIDTALTNWNHSSDLVSIEHTLNQSIASLTSDIKLREEAEQLLVKLTSLLDKIQIFTSSTESEILLSALSLSKAMLNRAGSPAGFLYDKTASRLIKNTARRSLLSNWEGMPLSKLSTSYLSLIELGAKSKIASDIIRRLCDRGAIKSLKKNEFLTFLAAAERGSLTSPDWRHDIISRVSVHSVAANAQELNSMLLRIEPWTSKADSQIQQVLKRSVALLAKHVEADRTCLSLRESLSLLSRLPRMMTTPHACLRLLDAVLKGETANSLKAQGLLTGETAALLSVCARLGCRQHGLILFESLIPYLSSPDTKLRARFFTDTLLALTELGLDHAANFLLSCGKTQNVFLRLPPDAAVDVFWCLAAQMESSSVAREILETNGEFLLKATNEYFQSNSIDMNQKRINRLFQSSALIKHSFPTLSSHHYTEIEQKPLLPASTQNSISPSDIDLFVDSLDFNPPPSLSPTLTLSPHTVETEASAPFSLPPPVLSPRRTVRYGANRQMSEALEVLHCLEQVLQPWHDLLPSGSPSWQLPPPQNNISGGSGRHFFGDVEHPVLKIAIVVVDSALHLLTDGKTPRADLRMRLHGLRSDGWAPLPVLAANVRAWRRLWDSQDKDLINEPETSELAPTTLEEIDHIFCREARMKIALGLTAPPQSLVAAASSRRRNLNQLSSVRKEGLEAVGKCLISLFSQSPLSEGVSAQKINKNKKVSSNQK